MEAHKVRFRRQALERRSDLKAKSLAFKRPGVEACEDKESFEDIIDALRAVDFHDTKWLAKLKRLLSTGTVDDTSCFFKGHDLHSLADVVSNGVGNEQLLAVQVVANFGPLDERSGLQMARAVGPFLVTLLSACSPGIREAAALALGNLGLAGFRVAKVLVNQEAVKSLAARLDSGCPSAANLYGLYHILHSLIAEDNFAVEELTGVTLKCTALFVADAKTSPVELYWLLFLLSCDPNQHEALASRAVVSSALDVFTYEIFQKADPRPLVKVVTPLVRLLANLCGGPTMSEQACLAILSHPDLTAILMALLGTNFTHLCRETLWLFANIINNESVVVQEHFVELNIMDKLEYHTVQAVHKVDPYKCFH